MRHREAEDNRLLVSYREMGLLTSHPPLMDKLDVLSSATVSTACAASTAS